VLFIGTIFNFLGDFFMSEMKSGEVRRFFDLLGSIFCGIVVGLSFGMLNIKANVINVFAAFPICIAICVYIFSVFPRFYWHFVGTKFLYGYFNFVLIAVSNVSLMIFAVTLCYLVNPWKGFNLNAEVLYKLYYFSLLPPTFFWILGIITAWKFSKSETLLR
jgi:hypothetical protein